MILMSLRDWPGAQNFTDATRRHFEEGDWLAGTVAASDSTGPHAPNNTLER
jgi:hypothetical protein